MIRIGCPVATQREGNTRDLIAEFPDEATAQDRINYVLRESDKLTRLACNVGDCAVMAMATLRVAGEGTATCFETSNPSLCVQGETTIFDTPSPFGDHATKPEGQNTVAFRFS